MISFIVREQIRQAEMELRKGQNMIEHEAEIFSRPARTWFQSGKEKAQAEGSCFLLLVLHKSLVPVQ